MKMLLMRQQAAAVKLPACLPKENKRRSPKLQALR